MTSIPSHSRVPARSSARDVVCCLALGDAQARYHITPLANSLGDGLLWILRPRTIPGPLPANVRQLTAPTQWRTLAILWMAWQCWRLTRRAHVRAVASFNPFPYGLIAGLAALASRKPFHLGWLGSDWHLQMKRGWGAVGSWLLRRAAFITVTGAQMEREVQQLAGSGARIAVLPHAIDLERFPVPGESTPRFDLISVGRLVPLKRIDLLLKVAAELRPRFPSLRVAIVGDGPLKHDLQTLACQLGLGGTVEFCGMVKDVGPLLRDSRLFVMCSDSEGLPFALIEAMCSGVVPVATAVGEIPDVIQSGDNGWLTPVDDAQAIAEAVAYLLTHPTEVARMRTQALRERDRWTYGRAEDAWARWWREDRRFEQDEPQQFNPYEADSHTSHPEGLHASQTL